MFKNCYKCKIDKHLSEFNRHTKAKDGRQHYCRECDRAKKKIRKDAKRKLWIAFKTSMRENLLGEIWRPVVGYEGRYEVSNMGRVWSMYNLVIMYMSPRSDGGCQVGLVDELGKRRGCCVHRLVGFAFIPNPENKPEIDHIDCNPANNKVENLQWATRSEQIRWSYERGRDRMFGELRRNAKLTNKQAAEVRKRYANGETYTNLRKEYGIGDTAMSLLVKNKSYKNV